MLQKFELLQLDCVFIKFDLTIWFDYHMVYLWGDFPVNSGIGVASNHKYLKEYFHLDCYS